MVPKSFDILYISLFWTDFSRMRFYNFTALATIRIFVPL